MYLPALRRESAFFLVMSRATSWCSCSRATADEVASGGSALASGGGLRVRWASGDSSGWWCGIRKGRRLAAPMAAAERFRMSAIEKGVGCGGGSSPGAVVATSDGSSFTWAVIWCVDSDRLLERLRERTIERHSLTLPQQPPTRRRFNFSWPQRHQLGCRRFSPPTPRLHVYRFCALCSQRTPLTTTLKKFMISNNLKFTYLLLK